MREDKTIQQLLPKQQHNPKIFGTCNCEIETRYDFTFQKDNIKQRNKQIMEMRKSGKKYKEISKIVGLTAQRVHQIVNYETLKQLKSAQRLLGKEQVITREQLQQRADTLLVFFEGLSYDSAIIGITSDERVVYSYCKMVYEAMQQLQCCLEDAIEWIETNTIPSLNYYINANKPIVVYDDWRL